MDIKQIQALIKFVSESGVSEVELETKDFKINIKTPSAATRVVEIAQPVAPVVVPQVIAAPAPSAVSAPPSVAVAPAKDDSKYITIKSPMIGTFYRSPSPDKPAFVNVGDDIKAGKVLCIIEAMKLFNEIEAEISGKVVKVLVDDSKPVEYDQPLFLIDPA